MGTRRALTKRGTALAPALEKALDEQRFENR